MLYSKREASPTRKPASQVTPLYEDMGLFKTAPCEIMLELIPVLRRNDRNDLVVRGFADRKSIVDVYFAGRRTAAALPLEARLKSLMAQLRKAAAEENVAVPDVERVRLPVRALGSWRRSFKRDEGGWQTARYDFMMARWSMLDRDGKTLHFGESPLVSGAAENLRQAQVRSAK